MTGAIFGLIGVVVGAMLNLVVLTLRERSTTKSAARAAARLVGTELLTFATVIRATRSRDPADLPQVKLLDTTAWTAYREVLARVLPDQSWTLVALAYAHVDGVLSLLVFEPDGTLADWRVSELRRELPRVFDAVSAAIGELGELGAPSRPPETLDDDGAFDEPWGTGGDEGPFPVYA
ncbi:hypothetical protein HP550_00645 [Cellulomonas humilata]|uniref:Uncharacterized protein n=1 Tax=Cellulomonas humilata TaxID=144055 RepID=A0A7Y6DW98_9CELL|nr:hypothetical protein [Cellulomonas humilata]NUU15757.1 hypothetical protein [Cellulomonas humilata]